MFAPVTFAGAFTPAECDRILTLTEPDAFAEGGLVRRQQNSNIRRARVHWLDDEAGAWVLERLMDVVAQTNRSNFGFDLTEFAERMQVAWYDGANEGHFDWHSDIGEGTLAAKRKLTMVVQLSDPDDYDGGALEVSPDNNIRTPG